MKSSQEKTAAGDTTAASSNVSASRLVSNVKNTKIKKFIGV
jgi:hypothetical protein